MHKQLFILPLVFSQLEGDTITLKPRPSADLTNSSAPSPSHKVQCRRLRNPKLRGASATRVSTFESGRCGAQPSPVGSRGFGWHSEV